MLALRHGERALPLAWRVEATAGPIGFAVQRELLEAAAPWVAEGSKVCLMADRFHGTAALIAWCQAQGWDYRLRLKGTLAVRGQDGRATTAAACARSGTPYLEGVALTARRVRTNIGVIHDPLSGCETSLAACAMRRALVVSHGPARPSGWPLAKARLALRRSATTWSGVLPVSHPDSWTIVCSMRPA